MNTQAFCPQCSREAEDIIFQAAGVPLYLLQLFHDRHLALKAKTGVLDFRYCHHCAFVFNASFDPQLVDYQVNYESGRSYSPIFCQFLADVASQVASHFEIKNRTVVEIGCGDGKFLENLLMLAPFEGYGFDPSQDFSNRPKNSHITFAKDYFYPDQFKNVIDVIILRHVLEHQPNDRSFLNQVLPFKQTQPWQIYVEVPAWEWIIDNMSFVAFSYEHCSYHTSSSLSKLMGSLGIAKTNLSYTFQSEYLQFFGTRFSSLIVEAPKVADQPNDVILEKTRHFVRSIDDMRNYYSNQFKQWSSDAVLWGAAGKGTMLINILGITYKDMPYVVDSNVKRQGTYIPKGGQEVVAPERLKNLQPKYIVLTNSQYAEEIRSQVHAMGLRPEFIYLDTLMKSMA